jgi:hypothetical protein
MGGQEVLVLLSWVRKTGLSFRMYIRLLWIDYLSINRYMGVRRTSLRSSIVSSSLVNDLVHLLIWEDQWQERWCSATEQVRSGPREAVHLLSNRLGPRFLSHHISNSYLLAPRPRQRAFFPIMVIFFADTSKSYYCNSSLLKVILCYLVMLWRPW